MKDWVLPWTLGVGTGLMIGVTLSLIAIDAPICLILYFGGISIAMLPIGLLLNC